MYLVVLAVVIFVLAAVHGFLSSRDQRIRSEREVAAEFQQEWNRVNGHKVNLYDRKD